MIKNSWKKLATLYGASLLAMPLGILISIFNTSVLGPDKFGDYKFIETVARLIGSIVSIGFFTSIARLMAINKETSREREYIGIFTIILIISSLIGVVLLFSFSFLEPYFFENNLGSTFRIYSFIVLAIIGNLALAQVLKGLHKIYTLALFGVIPLFAYLSIAYLINKTIPLGLEMVLILYYGIMLLSIISIIIQLKPNLSFKKSIIKELLKENKFNGRPIYFGSLAGVATTHIAGISIAYFMDNTQVGFYMLALTICSPILVIPSVLGTTFFKQFANMKKIPSKVFQISIAGSFLALTVFYLLVDWVIMQFYGETYSQVSGISKYLIFGFVLHGFGDLINRFLGAKGRGNLLRNAAFLVGIINILGYTFLIKYFSIDGAIITKIMASCLYLAVMAFYYYRFTKKI